MKASDVMAGIAQRDEMHALLVADAVAEALRNTDDALSALRRAETALAHCSAKVYQAYTERLIRAQRWTQGQQHDLQRLHHDFGQREREAWSKDVGETAR